VNSTQRYPPTHQKDRGKGIGTAQKPQEEKKKVEGARKMKFDDLDNQLHVYETALFELFGKYFLFLYD
jgi:hypothetical protein